MTLIRRAMRKLRRELRPTAEEAAWRAIEARAGRERRRTPGVLRLMNLDLEYVDALSLAPQWHDIFVRRTLDFRSATDAPCVLDCGANVGLATIWIKQRFPRARVTAFEADPAICAVMRRNVERNRIENVEVVQAAIWRENTRLAFRAEGSDSGAIDSVAAETPGAIVEVPAIRLRDRLAAAPVDLLKLDIEGAELDVLEDAADLLHQVRAIHVEVHDFAPARRLLPRCLMVLEGAGFTYALDDLISVNWRDEGRQPTPFVRAVPAWVVLVRAWRAETRA